MKKNEARAGFTLIEVLIAMVVLSIALAGMIPVLMATTRANSFGKWTTQAATYSQDKIEELRAEPWKDLAGNPNPKLLAGSFSDPVPSPIPDGFVRTWTVTDTGGLFSTRFIGIEVTTTWTDSQGGSHPSRVFATLSNPDT